MSDAPNGEHNGLRGRVEAIARNEFATGINRLLIIAGAPVFLALGSLVWSDMREGQAESKRAAEDLRREIVNLSQKIGDMKTDQAVLELKVQGLERRVDKIEAQGVGSATRTP